MEKRGVISLFFILAFLFILSLDYVSSETNVSSCTTLTTDNELYTLNQSINSTETCILITGANITLDCKGYLINYSIEGADSTHGVYSYGLNTTVKDCIIVDGNWTSTNSWRNGITYINSNNGLIQNNTINVSLGRGVALSSANYSIIINNNITSFSGVGISMEFSSNTNLTSNTGNSTSGVGIYFYYSDNNTLTNNSGFSNSSHGIDFDYSKNNTLSNNIGKSNSSMQGILVRQNSSGNVLINNTGISLSGSGIYLYVSADNNTLINNIGISNSGYGIMLYSNSNNTLINNNGTSNAGSGIYLQYSSNNTLINNTARSNTYPAIQLYISSHNNTLRNNTGISGSNDGIAITSSSNNNLIANNFTGNYGYYFESSNYTNVTDCSYISGSTADIYISSTSGSINNIFLNCSYNLSKESVSGAANTLVRKWYFDANVSYANGTAIPGANFTIYNSSSAFVYSELGNSTGDIIKQELTEYVNTGGTRNFDSLYTVNVTKTGFTSNSTNYNITTLNNVFANIILESDTLPPNYSLVSVSTTLGGSSAVFSIFVEDNSLLDSGGGYIFSTNNTGTWANNSFVIFTANPSWANVTKTLNSTTGMIIGYRWYFNDSTGNTNSTPVYELTTTEERDEGDGGGSSGGVTSSNTILLSLDQLRKGYSRIFKKDNQIKFNFSNQERIVKISSVSGEGIILIEDSNNYSILVGSLEKIPLNSSYSLEITLNSISGFNSSANILFKLIEEEMLPQEQEGVNENTGTLVHGEDEESVGKEDEGSKEKKILSFFNKYKKEMIYVAGGIFVLIIMLVFIIFLVHNSRKNALSKKENNKIKILELVERYEYAKKAGNRKDCLKIYEEIKKAYENLPEDLDFKKTIYERITKED